MRFVIMLFSVLLLNACGADGEPMTPTMSSTIGVGTNGAYGNVSVYSGPVTVSVGRNTCYNCW